MLRMKASALIRKASDVAGARPRQAAPKTVALEADVVGLGGREGGEVVAARQGGGDRRRARPGRRGGATRAPGPLERDCRGAWSAAGSGSCARSRRRGRRSRRRPARQPSRRCRVGTTPFSAATRSPGDLRLGLEAGHLAASVDAGVGAPGHRQRDRLAQDRRQRHLQLFLDRAQAGLLGPAREAGAVVFDIEAVGRAIPLPLPEHRLRLDQLEVDHLGRVGATRAELDDAGVAAGARRVARRDLVEQLVDDELVVVQRRQRLAAGVQVAAFGERDQLLDLGLDRLGLGLAGLDPLVLDQLLGEVREQRLAVRSSRGSACCASCCGALALRSLSSARTLVLLEVEAAGVQGLDHFLDRLRPKFGIAFSSARDLRTRSPTVWTPARLRQL